MRLPEYSFRTAFYTAAINELENTGGKRQSDRKSVPILPRKLFEIFYHIDESQ